MSGALAWLPGVEQSTNSAARSHLCTITFSMPETTFNFIKKYENLVASPFSVGVCIFFSVCPPFHVCTRPSLIQEDRAQ